MLVSDCLSQTQGRREGLDYLHFCNCAKSYCVVGVLTGLSVSLFVLFSVCTPTTVCVLIVNMEPEMKVEEKNSSQALQVSFVFFHFVD